MANELNARPSSQQRPLRAGPEPGAAAALRAGEERAAQRAPDTALEPQ